MINPQCLELPMSGTNLQSPKDVRVIEVRLFMEPPCTNKDELQQRNRRRKKTERKVGSH